MRILSGLFNPSLEPVETLLIIDTESKKNPTNPLVEWSHNGPKGLLPSLDST